MSDILNYLLSDARSIGKRSRRPGAHRTKRLAECKRMATWAERMAKSAAWEADRYRELADRWRAIATEIVSHDEKG